MNPDDEKKTAQTAEAEAAKPGEALPEGALDGVAGGDLAVIRLSELK
ncbi:MAG: hypothetical protein IK082_06550 [Oscillospiraceae bacterium]|nr:hypothetical protein [Oscillospiraceae bacterium]